MHRKDCHDDRGADRALRDIFDMPDGYLMSSKTTTEARQERGLFCRSERCACHAWVELRSTLHCNNFTALCVVAINKSFCGALLWHLQKGWCVTIL